jgi:hypothetical protein
MCLDLCQDMIKELFQLCWVGRDEYENAKRAYDDCTVQVGSVERDRANDLLDQRRLERGKRRAKTTQSFLLLIDSERRNLCRTKLETNHYIVNK